mmetsp:Transcript_28977/g.47441  ORF Transcript_28977/g.47441 Transcript_28977/m.47441 type:complete len:271 (-) Transcript_28977:42-854(-)|eukprot:CAMPEP_0202712912 /NCGR_PEP_ID=MMETSP1385-20130828/47563_1 /ASSEMBLY_ACC=CAM_ASM_000861 /TAXON_ID=933848 /ORGANISM="Elphidium margaritaceum" /LENGTH=270 /DNA_ID=CAMNT_0049373103 /DNA_START=19 /DNA_END=834 /DNA_ORIENTATION=-
MKNTTPDVSDACSPLLRVACGDCSTPICSESEQSDEDADITDPGSKQWYMSFPSSSALSQRSVNNEEFPILHSNFLYSVTFNVENLQRRQTDIFNSMHTINVNHSDVLSDLEGGDGDNDDDYDDVMIDGEAVTMMGFIGQSQQQMQWRHSVVTNVYSEGHICTQISDASGYSMRKHEGSNDSACVTLMCPWETTPICCVEKADEGADDAKVDHDSEDDHDAQMQNDECVADTLMGGVDEQSITNINVTLMGHVALHEHITFDDGAGNKKS